MKSVFLKPRMVGRRFDEHTLPLDVLKDWAAFEEMVVELAKHLYIAENPTRKRTPKGFTEDFSLHLSGVEPGSAIPVLERISAGKLPLGGDYFERALVIVQAAILAAATDAPLPADFPNSCLGYFDRFGKSLREGESIEWTAPGTSQPTIYDRTTRKRLVLSGSKTYQSAADLRGWITQINAEKSSYTIKLISGLKLVGKYPRELADDVHGCLRDFEVNKFQGNKVLIRCVADYDGNDQPLHITETQHIEILDPNDVTARCEELALLKAGWCDGGGVPPDREGLKWFNSAWEALERDAVPQPYIYPTEDGGIQLEWTIANHEISAEVNLSGKTAVLRSVDVATGDMTESEADLSVDEGWNALAAIVNIPKLQPA